MRTLPSPRLVLGAAVLVVTACAPRPNTTEFISVKVTWEPAVQASCFRVTATSALSGGGSETRRTQPMARPADGAVLDVAIFRDGTADSATLQALGFSDADCTVSTGERSDAVEVSFTTSQSREPETLLVRAQPVGMDLDGDGVLTPEDCDDGNRAIAPGLAEACGDAFDNDCNGDADCADPACASQACAPGAVCRATACAEAECGDDLDNEGDGPRDCADPDCAAQPCGVGGTCTGGVCLGATEVSCTDGVDNDGDQAIDCADSDCATRACNDGDGCTTGETCSGSTCGGGQPRDCSAGLPVCLVNAGCDAGQCLAAAAPATTGCDDGNPCTTPDACDGDGGCRGAAVACGAPPGPCFGAGVCQVALDGGCAFPVVTTNSCSDNDGCTLNDSCQADGGCAGAALNCSTPPSECQAWANTCTGGACDWAPRTGACGDGGTCSGGACVPLAGWPYAPSNFDPGAVGPADGGVMNVNCTTLTLDTGPAAPAFTPSNCAIGAPGNFSTSVIQLPNSGGEAVLVSASGMTVTGGSTLRLVGTRPVIFAMRGDVTITGQVLVGPFGGRPGAGADPATGCAGGTGGNGLPNASTGGTSGAGAGGGGFGSAGARGAAGGGTSGAAGDGGVAVGNAELLPLRGGCSGGRGGYSSSGSLVSPGGQAGGAVQLSATGAVSLAGTVGAPGAGGPGGAGTMAGAGGGGSGGAILVEGTSLTLGASARVLALGGGGGEGSGDGAGNLGDDGSSGSVTSNTAAAGGSGSSMRGGEGGDGAFGTTAAGAGSPGIVSGTAGGGGAGGGGVGRIRLNITGGCVLPGGAVIAPTQSTPDGGCR